MHTKHDHSTTPRIVYNRSLLIKECLPHMHRITTYNALNDKGKLGTIYRGFIHYILAKYGGA